MSSLYVACFCAAVRQVVEVGGIPYVEYGDEPEPLEDSVPEPNQHNDLPVCGQCVNFYPSRFNPASGYCPCTLSRNEWDEIEMGKPVASSDPACSLFQMDCPF
ncbi:MAG: hypothetical protein ACKO24_03475 [Leptolyngbyaceae cyanobacterium]